MTKLIIFIITILLTIPSYAATLKLAAIGFSSSKTVQIRVYDLTDATEDIAWTSTGVIERSLGTGASTYYYSFSNYDPGHVYIIDWKDNSSPVVSTSEVLNEVNSFSLDSAGRVGINLDNTSGTLSSTEIPKLDAANSDIDDGVWAIDATGQQTQGTFGQAIGDPAADGTTMWSVINSTGDKLPTNYIMGSAVLTAKDDEIDAIKTKADFLPSATAGTAGGVFIAGTNAATTITTGLTTTFTGNLTGSVGSVATDVGITQAGADKVWNTTTKAITDKAGFSLADNTITNLTIAAGAVGASERQLASGTESGTATSIATKIYTALSTNSRQYLNMCIESAIGANTERTRIIGYGNDAGGNYFTVRGFSAAPANTAALSIHDAGCQ